MLPSNDLKSQIFAHKNIIPQLETDMDTAGNVRVGNLKATNTVAPIADITMTDTGNR